MAACGAGSSSQDGRACFLRLAALVIDGGTLALKTRFDMEFPPRTLRNDLQDPNNFLILKELRRKRTLRQEQYNLLFPAHPIQADSSNFDISLFACLIQNLPAFNQITSVVWNQHGPPHPQDLTLAADVQR